jgi:hypothetical protein
MLERQWLPALEDEVGMGSKNMANYAKKNAKIMENHVRNGDSHGLK